MMAVLYLVCPGTSFIKLDPDRFYRHSNSVLEYYANSSSSEEVVADGRTVLEIIDQDPLTDTRRVLGYLVLCVLSSRY